MAEGNRHRLFQMTPVSKGWRCGSAQLKLLKMRCGKEIQKKAECFFPANFLQARGGG